MKKILMLGASHFQVPAIKYAKEAGYHVVTADYKPENPGHEYADEYHNISTLDFDEILRLAESLNIDGILSYASDPGAPTAAYVAEKMGLPGNPFESVLILQQKDKFRDFLSKNGFNVPKFKSFKIKSEAKVYADFLLNEYGSIIIKPVDSSGSKGVSKIQKINEFDTAYESALAFSFSKKVVVEQFITKKGYQMDGDGFVWDKKLVFSCFGNQHNDFTCHAHVPVGISFPFIQPENIQQNARNDINKIMNLLSMQVGGLNIEYIIDVNDQVYLLEIGPRSGGNLIPEVIKYSTGVDLIQLSVEGALGADCSHVKQVDTTGFYSSFILHSTKDGIVDEIVIDDRVVENVIQKQILVKNGDFVNKFAGSHHTLGTFILKFENINDMLDKLDDMNSYISIKHK